MIMKRTMLDQLNQDQEHTMKPKDKILLILSIFLLIISVTPAAAVRGSILDHYRSLPPNLLNGHQYQLQFQNNQWVSHSLAGDPIKPIVDIENGYLKITDKGKGVGSMEQELGFFRTRAGNGILGVNLITFNGTGSIGTLRFYSFVDNQWKDITEDVLPQVDLSLFLDENDHSSAKERGKISESIVYLYQLPRTGTTISVKPARNPLPVKNNGHDKKTTATGKEILKNLKYREAKLIWDKKHAKFTVGGKTMSAPSGTVSQDQKSSPARSEKPAGKVTPESKPLSGSYTPAPGDDERQAILDALRKAIKSQSGADVKFEVRYLKVNSGWAWLRVLPHASDGVSSFEEVSALLQQTKGLWKLVETRPTDCGDNPDCADDTRYFKNLKTRFPAVPPNIFPD
jgi:hypothetical protein